MGFFALDFRRCTGSCQIGGFQHGNSKLRKGQERKVWSPQKREVTRRYEKCSLTLLLQIHKVTVTVSFFSGGLDKLMEHLRHRFRKSNLKSMCFCKCLKLFLQHWSQHPHYGGQPLECCGHVLSWRKSEHFDMRNYFLHNKPSMVASAKSNGMISTLWHLLFLQDLTIKVVLARELDYFEICW